jgi:hypothetical protein
MRYRLQEDRDDGGSNERRLSNSCPLPTGFERERKGCVIVGNGATQSYPEGNSVWSTILREWEKEEVHK